MSNERDNQMIIKDTNVNSFYHPEDYILFGLLVSHGLFQARDMALLAKAQEDAGGEALVDLLARSSDLDDRSRLNLGKLLDILRNPDLANFLPGSLPPIETIVETLRLPPENFKHGTAKEEETRVDPPMGDQPTVRDVMAKTVVDEPVPPHGQAVTDPHATEVGEYSVNETLSKSLTAEELTRVTRGRARDGLIGRELSGHVVLDRLGSGGQGDVYLAKQLNLGRYVALKKLMIPRSADRDQFVDAFRMEARMLGRISHSRIVKVYDIFEVDGTAFFTMEHVSGSTLKELADEAGGAPALDVIANLACQACGALEMTAAEGLVHRDIKPANMLLDTNGDLKIVDFGLAAASAELTQADTVLFAGTPAYASPEQYELASLTPHSDMYSLGVTLYFTLTGQLPFKCRTVHEFKRAHLEDEPTPPSQINNSLPTLVDDVILRMMAKRPEDRFNTFADCYNAWQEVLVKESRQTVSPTKQLLGDTLLRFGKGEKDSITKTSAMLASAWILVTAGVMLGEARFRSTGLAWFLDFCGTYGTYLLAFSLFCIFYVAAARRKYLPIFGSLRVWLYTHIATAIPAVIMLLIHSGNFLFHVGVGPRMPPPLLTIVVSITLLVTAISGTVGLMIFRSLRRKVLLQQLNLRGTEMTEADKNRLLFGARALSGWRLVHYPLAIFFILLSVLHIIQAVRFSVN